jgi:hypothetical protein
MRMAFPSPTASQIGARVWSYAGVLKDDGLIYMGYVEQLTFLLFLKMAGELTKATYNRPNGPRRGKTRRVKRSTTTARHWPGRPRTGCPSACEVVFKLAGNRAIGRPMEDTIVEISKQNAFARRRSVRCRR